MKRIGKAMRQYRYRKGFTLQEAAKKANIAEITLSSYEKGEQIMPVTVFTRLAKLYELDNVDEMLNRIMGS